MELEKARAIAENLKKQLSPFCEKIEIAGSVRRLKPEPKDIELLCVPSYRGEVNLLDSQITMLMSERVLALRRNKRGGTTYGPKNKLLLHPESGIGIDVFSTTEECWWVALAIRTGPKESNITIAKAAIRKGWRLLAYGSGFNTHQGLVRCKSEREVFELVGLPYQEPWERR